MLACTRGKTLASWTREGSGRFRARESRRGRQDVRAVAVGLLIEEQRADVAAAWKRAVEDELGGEAALAFAVGPLLREMALALRGEESPHRKLDPDRPGDGTLRSVVLVRSGASPSRVAREFKLLHRSLWDALRAAGRIIAADERRAADEWLDDALAASLDRLDRVRMRIDLLERGPAAAPAEAKRPIEARRAAGSLRPPPLPRSLPPLRSTQRPPPLPPAASYPGIE
jgi:hypothetical protein